VIEVMELGAVYNQEIILARCWGNVEGRDARTRVQIFRRSSAATRTATTYSRPGHRVESVVGFSKIG